MESSDRCQWYKVDAVSSGRQESHCLCRASLLGWHQRKVVAVHKPLQQVSHFQACGSILPEVLDSRWHRKWCSPKHCQCCRMQGRFQWQQQDLVCVNSNGHFLKGFYPDKRLTFMLRNSLNTSLGRVWEHPTGCASVSHWRQPIFSLLILLPRPRRTCPPMTPEWLDPLAPPR